MQVTSIASHAARILELRSVENADGFRAELDQALSVAASQSDPERLDLLQTVAHHFQKLATAGEPPGSPKFNAGCALLKNLLR